MRKKLKPSSGARFIFNSRIMRSYIDFDKCVMIVFTKRDCNWD